MRARNRSQRPISGPCDKQPQWRHMTLPGHVSLPVASGQQRKFSDPTNPTVHQLLESRPCPVGPTWASYSRSSAWP